MVSNEMKQTGPAGRCKFSDSTQSNRNDAVRSFPPHINPDFVHNYQAVMSSKDEARLQNARETVDCTSRMLCVWSFD